MDCTTRNIIIEDRFKGFVPLFSAIANIQDGLFCTELLGSIEIIIWDKAPMCVYRNPYNEESHSICLSIDPDYPYQAAYQFSHEYCHIKTKFWKTFKMDGYRFKYLEEALAYCMSIINMQLLSVLQPTASWPGAENFSKYALKDVVDIASLPKSISTWLKENYPEPLGSDFLADEVQEQERKRSKILGCHLIQFATAPCFWKAASVLTEACSSGHQPCPATIEELFEQWIRFCSPDAARALSDVRSTLICTC